MKFIANTQSAIQHVQLHEEKRSNSVPPTMAACHSASSLSDVQSKEGVRTRPTPDFHPQLQQLQKRSNSVFPSNEGLLLMFELRDSNILVAPVISLLLADLLPASMAALSGSSTQGGGCGFQHRSRRSSGGIKESQVTLTPFPNGTAINNK